MLDETEKLVNKVKKNNDAHAVIVSVMIYF